MFVFLLAICNTTQAMTTIDRPLPTRILPNEKEQVPVRAIDSLSYHIIRDRPCFYSFNYSFNNYVKQNYLFVFFLLLLFIILNFVRVLSVCLQYVRSFNVLFIMENSTNPMRVCTK